MQFLSQRPTNYVNYKDNGGRKTNEDSAIADAFMMKISIVDILSNIIIIIIMKTQ